MRYEALVEHSVVLVGHFVVSVEHSVAMGELYLTPLVFIVMRKWVEGHLVFFCQWHRRNRWCTNYWFLVLDDDGGADVVDPDSSFFVVYPLLLPSTTNASFLLALI